VKTWPDVEEKLLRSYVAQLDFDRVLSRRPCESVLRRFQRYVMAHAVDKPLTQQTVEAWLRERIRP